MDYIQQVLNKGGYFAVHGLEVNKLGLHSTPQGGCSLMDINGKLLRDNCYKSLLPVINDLCGLEWKSGNYTGTEYRLKEWHDKEVIK